MKGQQRGDGEEVEEDEELEPLDDEELQDTRDMIWGKEYMDDVDVVHAAMFHE